MAKMSVDSCSFFLITLIYDHSKLYFMIVIVSFHKVAFQWSECKLEKAAVHLSATGASNEKEYLIITQEREREIETERQRDREIERETERQREREAPKVIFAEFPELPLHPRTERFLSG